MSPPNSSSRLTAHGLIGAGELAQRDAVLLLHAVPMVAGSNSPSGLSNTGLMLVAGLQHVDRLALHQLLQPVGERRFAAADGAEQVEDLLALLEPLCGGPEVADDALDRLLEAIEVPERWIDLECAVHEDPAEARILGGVDDTPARRWRSSCAPRRWRKAGIAAASCRYCFSVTSVSFRRS